MQMPEPSSRSGRPRRQRGARPRPQIPTPPATPPPTRDPRPRPSTPPLDAAAAPRRRCRPRRRPAPRLRPRRDRRAVGESGFSAAGSLPKCSSGRVDFVGLREERLSGLRGRWWSAPTLTVCADGVPAPLMRSCELALCSAAGVRAVFAYSRIRLFAELGLGWFAYCLRIAASLVAGRETRQGRLGCGCSCG